VESSIYVHIIKCGTAREVWTTLENLYEEKGLSRKINLLRNLIGSILGESDGMQAYVDKILKHTQQLSSIGFDISDEWSTAILLAGLTEKYQPFIMGIEAAGTKLTDNIISKLLDFQDDKSGEAFAASKGRKPTPKDKSYNCGGFGHVRKYCKKPAKSETGDNKRNTNDGKANNAFSALLASETKSKDCWFIDSGASNHMTLHSSILNNIRRSEVINIVAADKRRYNAQYKRH
jgi:hypothetical protein